MTHAERLYGRASTDDVVQSVRRLRAERDQLRLRDRDHARSMHQVPQGSCAVHAALCMLHYAVHAMLRCAVLMLRCAVLMLRWTVLGCTALCCAVLWCDLLYCSGV